MPPGQRAGTVARARTVAPAPRGVGTRRRVDVAGARDDAPSGPRAEQVKPRDAVLAAGGCQRR